LHNFNKEYQHGLNDYDLANAVDDYVKKGIVSPHM
jgi:hypothetical protein